MDTHLLEDIGLTKNQSAGFKILLEQGACRAPELSRLTGESRTNSYKILDKLCEIGLAQKDTSNKRQTYYPTNPVALEKLVRKRLDETQLLERKLEAAMPGLISQYFSKNDQPGVRYFHGNKGIQDIYLDQIKAKQTVYFIRGDWQHSNLDFDAAHKIRNLFPLSGIMRHAIVQDNLYPDIRPDDSIPTAESDKIVLLNRTWINQSDYDAPVEWAAYGDRLSITSFGKEDMGIVIQSPQIAEAFRKLYKLLETKIKATPGYQKFPKNALYTRTPSKALLKNYSKTQAL